MAEETAEEKLWLAWEMAFSSSQGIAIEKKFLADAKIPEEKLKAAERLADYIVELEARAAAKQEGREYKALTEEQRDEARAALLQRLQEKGEYYELRDEQSDKLTGVYTDGLVRTLIDDLAQQVKPDWEAALAEQRKDRNFNQDEFLRRF